MSLPEYATLASRKRLQLSQMLAATYPLPSVEISLTGSAAHGWATDDSDLEVNIWADSLPTSELRLAWLRTLGVKGLAVHDRPRNDNSYWISGVFQHVPIEVGWQTPEALEQAIFDVLMCTTLNHKELRLIDLILSAIPLRGGELSALWHERLSIYPPELQAALIDDSLEAWAAPTWVCEPAHEIPRILRLLFALNRQWEINWKYAAYQLDRLHITPVELRERLAYLKQVADVGICLDLIRDTVLLVPDAFNPQRLLARF